MRNKGNTGATIKDVAAMAGVSISTVSRALSGKTYVEEETKARVLGAVEKLHYKPNLIAKGLKEKKTNMIAVMIPALDSLYYAALTRSIEQRATEAGYSVMFCNSQNDPEKERKSLEMLKTRLVDGIICLTINDQVEHVLKMRRSENLPIVLLNRDLKEDISCVSIDMEYGSYLMTEYLLKRGHRKIAGVFENLEKQRHRRRYRGYVNALRDYHVGINESYVLSNATEVEDAYHKAKELFSREDHPTAVFVSEEMMVLGVYRALTECGLSIPQDVSVVGFDNIYTAEYMYPALTTYNSMVEEVSRKSVEILLEEIEEGSAPQKIVMRGDVIERESVRSLDV